ncbi:hypothetical protein D3C75_1195560 [compost metagenome]
MGSGQLFKSAGQRAAAALESCCAGIQGGYTFGKRCYTVYQLTCAFSQHKQIILQLQCPVIQLGCAIGDL